MANILLLGLGGAGCEIVNKTNEYFVKIGKSEYLDCLGIDYEDHGGLAVYKDFEVKDAAGAVQHYWEKDNNFKIHWPSHKNKPYTHSGKIGIGSAAGQIRANGRLAALCNLNHNRDAGIQPQLKRFLEKQGVIDANRKEGPEEQKYIVFVICSLGGGTGSGIFHDVIFSLRPELKSQDSLIGLFLDGTVVKKWASSNTGIMGYASLVEMEHWMARAKDYYEIPLIDDFTDFWSHVQSMGAIPGQFIENLTYLDLALLISHENENRRILTGLRSGSVKGDYIELASGWLKCLLLGDIITQKVEKNEWEPSYLFENLFNHYTGSQRKPRNNRAVTYGSVGVSLLSVPVNKISRYLAAKILVNFIASYDQYGQFNIEAERYLEDNEIDENVNRKLTELIKNSFSSDEDTSRKSKGQHRIYNDIDSSIGALNRSKNYEQLMKNVRSFGLSIPDKKWNPNVEQYKSEFETITKSLYLEKMTELDDTISNLFKSNSPNRIINWLDLLNKRVSKCIQTTEKNMFVQSGNWINSIKNHTSDASKFTKIQQWLKWDDIQSFIIQDLNKLRNELSRLESKTLKDCFYRPFQNALNLRITCIKYMQEPLNEILEHEKGIVADFTIRDSFIDESKLKNNQHPLELEIGTHESFIKLAENKLNKSFDPKEIKIGEDKNKESSKTINLYDIIGHGKVFEKSKFNWSGFCHYYKSFVAEYEKWDKDHSLPMEIEPLKADIFKGINNLIDESVITEIKQFINKNFNLWSAISDYLDQMYFLAKSYTPNSKNSSEIKQKFVLHFEKEGTSILLDNDKLKQDEWTQEALVYLITRLSGFSSLFWRQNETLKRECESEDREFTGLNRFIYCPQNEIKKILNNRKSEALRNFKLFNIDDPHTLAIMQISYGYPIYTVVGYEEDRMRYQDHIQKWRAAEAYEPFHIDQRFYTTWKDNVGEKISLSSSKRDLIYYVYLLSIGSEIITTSVSGTRAFKFDGKTISRGLPKLLDKLNKDEKLLYNLCERNLDTIGSLLTNAGLGHRYAQENIWEILLKGHKIHIKSKPPETRANAVAYAAWEDISNSFEIRKTGDGSWKLRGTLLPRDKKDFDKIYGVLRK